MRLGIYGGSFDPVHYGHLLLAEQCREQCQLDEIWFVPARQSPLKASIPTLGKDRVEMLRFATSGQRGFAVSGLELERDGVSWTVETLRQIKRLRPDDKLFLLIGADALRDFPSWREAEEIAALSTLVAVNRGDFAAESVLGALSETIRRKVRFVTMPGVAISASDVRSRVADGRSIRFFVPRAVEEYIREHGLYRNRS